MKKIVVFGGGGLIGSRFISLHKDAFEIKAPKAKEIDILSEDLLKSFLEQENPDCIINFAAFTDVEEAEKEKDNKDALCFHINAIGAQNVAEACKKINKRLIHISTEYVFDGTKAESPYTEKDKPNPINWYGQTKLIGEQMVLEAGAEVAIARISMPFSAHYELKKDVARFFLEHLRSGNPVKAISDQKITPILVDDISNALKILLDNKASGIYHLASRDSVTPLEFVRTIAEIFNLDDSLIESMDLAEYNLKKQAKLLQNSWLSPVKFEKEFGGQILHTVKEGLVIFKQAIDLSR